jgi:dihydrofolate reductase
MRKLILKMSMSVDGFVGGPNGELEWLFRNSDPEGMAWTVETIWQAGVHIMGSRTFRDMAAYWPTSAEPFAAPMNQIPKVVFSRRGLSATGNAASTTRALADARAQAPRPRDNADAAIESWTAARVAGGDLADEIARLKQEPGKDILAHGGAGFAQSLIEGGLVDEFRLAIHPVALGRGLPIFSRLAKPLDLELVEAKTFSRGAVAHIYRKRA